MTNSTLPHNDLLDTTIGAYVRAGQRHLPIAQHVVASARLTAGEHVVDLGCGTGSAALLAGEQGADVTGVEATLRLLDISRARAEEHELDARFLAGAPEAMPIADGSADAIVSIFGLDDAPCPADVAWEISRVLSDRGRLVFSTWVPAGEPDGFAWHERDALRVLLGPHGFEVATQQLEHDGRRCVVVTACRG
jgi:SAM-dependent methyltransferase